MTDRKIVRYDVVACYDWGEVAVDVNKLLKDGWQPYGAPFVSGTSLCQAVVQYEDEQEGRSEKEANGHFEFPG